MRDSQTAGSILLDSHVSSSFKRYGICGTCKEFVLIKRMNTEHAFCNWQCGDAPPIRLSCTDRIIDCTKYYPRGQMSLWEMKREAMIIDIHEKKAGFGPPVREVEIKAPRDDED
jgi:hypothetical protein